MLDFLIVGSGFYGAVLARELKNAGFSVRVIEKRKHIGGNCFTEQIKGIHVHKYGMHYFHTNKRDVWQYVNKYSDFTTYLHRAKASYDGQIYSFPINLMTLYQVYGVSTPEQAKNIVSREIVPISHPSNLEEYVISKIGRKLYSMFYEGYSTKQWGVHPSKVSASVGKRIPIRFNFDDSYHSDVKYQGVPINGYADLFNNLLDGIIVDLNTDFDEIKPYWRQEAKHLIYSGQIDSYFDHQFGWLDYRSLRHETKIIQNCDFQGTAQVNYTGLDVSYTRINEHKHVGSSHISDTVITYEYPVHYHEENEPFYPVYNPRTAEVYRQYRLLSLQEVDVTIGGRLGVYKYMDMDDVIQMALLQARKFIAKHE